MRLYTDKQLQARVGTAVDAAVAAAVAPLLARIAELEQETARLKKNSSNSSTAIERHHQAAQNNR